MITIRTKLLHVDTVDKDGNVIPMGDYVILPKITKKHCDMAYFRNHKKYGGYANSDLFERMINRDLKELGIGGYMHVKEFTEHMSIEEGFLATITINI